MNDVRDLRGKHWGKSAWIVGSGKSLLKTPPEELQKRGAITFAFNSIFLRERFRPTYHLVEDRLVAADRAADINAWHGPQEKIYAEDVSHLLNGSRTRYVPFQRGHHPSFPQFSFDCAERVYWGGTVSYMAIQLAYYMGIHTLYCVGMDKYQPPTKKDKVDGVVITSGGDDPNHFDPRYFGKGLRWHDPCEERMQTAHERCMSVWQNAGRRIVDCTAAEKRSLDGIYPYEPFRYVLAHS